MKQARVLTQAEIKRVLTYCNGTKHPIRNRLAVLLSHYAGLRVGEIASLTWDQLLDVNGDVRDQFYLAAHSTKSKEARLVHINGKLAGELKAAKNFIKSKNGPVIQSQRGGHFSANSLAQVFARLYAGVGFEDASSHSGRRWFITELAKKGVTSKTIMELAGHKQLRFVPKPMRALYSIMAGMNHIVLPWRARREKAQRETDKPHQKFHWLSLLRLRKSATLLLRRYSASQRKWRIFGKQSRWTKRRRRFYISLMRFSATNVGTHPVLFLHFE